MMMNCEITGKPLSNEITHKLKIDTNYNSIFDYSCDSLQESIVISEEILIKTIQFWQSLPEFNPSKKIIDVIECIDNSKLDGIIKDWENNILIHES